MHGYIEHRDEQIDTNEMAHENLPSKNKLDFMHWLLARNTARRTDRNQTEGVWNYVYVLE